MVVLALRLVLALVFAGAAVGKLADRSGSVRALREFGLPDGLLDLAAVTLPAFELSIGVALLFNGSAQAAAAGALVLLVCFVAAIVRALARGQAPDCHCFGQLHSAPAGRGTLARNALLGALAAALVASGPGRSPTALGAEDLALLATSVFSVLLLVAAVALWRENRRLRARPASRQAPLVQGLPPGTPAPDLRLSTLTGESVSLHSVIGSGRPAALVRLSPTCGPCRALLPELLRWQRTLAHRLDVVAVSTGGLDDNRAFAEEHGLQELYVDAARVLGEAYLVRPTPSAVLIDGQGRVAAAPAAGARAIEALIRLALQEEQEAPV